MALVTRSLSNQCKSKASGGQARLRVGLRCNRAAMTKGVCFLMLLRPRPVEQRYFSSKVAKQTASASLRQAVCAAIKALVWVAGATVRVIATAK